MIPVGVIFLAVAVAYTRLDPAFIKPPIDSREYLGITLDNDLRAVVVSDPEANNTSIAINVLVDAHEIISSVAGKGIQNCYNAAVGKSVVHFNVLGGSTMYMLEVGKETLNKALERLYKCFSYPKNISQKAFNCLMESERAKGLISDSSRQKAPTLAEIKSYLRSNYLVNGMRIAVVGPQPVDTLAEEVEKAFSDVKDLPLKEPQAPVKTSSSCFDPKPKADNSVMYIQAKLPSQKKNPLTRPLEYIEFMILRKTSGTLVDTLIRKKWVTGVTIDPEKQCAQSKFHLSTITFHLTETANKQAINALFFKYLKLINKKGVNLVYFNEVKFYAHRYFKYPADKNKGPTDILYIINDAELPGNRLSEAIALSLTSECPFHLAWKCTRDLESFDPKAISDLLESFINAINQNSLPTDSDQSPKAYSNIQLSLPTKNKYFPASYDDTITIRGTEIKQIYNKPNGLVWHTFGGITSDYVVVRFSISPPMESITQETEAKLGILIHYYTTLLQPIDDLIQITESSISVETGARGLKLTFYGTTTNTFILDEIITTVLEDNIDFHSFQAAKNSTLENQRKSYIDSTYLQPFREGMAPLLSHEFAPIHLINATEATSFEEIQELQRHLFSTSYAEILCLGDINHAYLEQLSKKLIPGSMKTAPHLAKFPQPTKLSPNTSYVYPMLSHNPTDNSSIVLFYLETYHLENPRSRFTSLIVMHLMQSLLLPSLNEIGAANIYLNRIIHRGGIILVIESQDHPTAIELGVESKLQHFHKLVKDLTPEGLRQEIANIQQKFIPALYEKVDHYWDSIKFRSYDFGWEKDYFKFMDKLKISALLEFIEGLVVPKAPGRTKFSVHVMPANQQLIHPQLSQLGEIIPDGLKWRSQQSFWDYPPNFVNRTL
ncbi:hypothetical protein DSO57_1026122 [Entomophthora muscae]|uniref:Uncharacterized protein n=2 Tax=Entomophthora muscae TaxID=34485 RepID=A0ACC2SF12_9FUNG|nr:hypothetical protein DSO57_1026122 [Entomophthora muscae]